VTVALLDENRAYVIERAELSKVNDMDKQMSIQEVSDRLGLPKSTLRYWEKAFIEFFAPTRTPGGQRRYSEEDMKIISSICKYKKMGFSLSQIKAHILNLSNQHKKIDPCEIDQLAKRIASKVKSEIHIFLNRLDLK
jgi:DNA-binding transcriptional MerR regulator